jgi:hypothetical protein
MPDYDTQRFDPPAPTGTVDLRAQGKSVPDVPMLIDSGSDMSFLPGASVKRLGLQPDQQRRYEVTAFDGTRSQSASVQCDLVFRGRVFRGVYLVLEAEYGILGRDILNHLSIVLDGPGLNWKEGP